MRRESLQPKRRPTKGAILVLHSKTRRRKRHRVSAGTAEDTDLGSEVPNLGVARALFVILILHVAAIAAIFIHNKVTNDDPVVRESPVREHGAASDAAGAKAVPEPQPGEDYYFVATGDTYGRIAELKGVDVNELRRLNGNVGLRAGKLLRIPPNGMPSALPERPVAGAAAETGSRQAGEAERPESAAPASETEDPASPAGRAVIVEESPEDSEAPAEAVMVKPRIDPRAATATARTAEESGHKVGKGETIWSISRRYKVSQKQLLEANGITDPRRLQVGMTLKIPAGNGGG